MVFPEESSHMIRLFSGLSHDRMGTRPSCTHPFPVLLLGTLADDDDDASALVLAPSRVSSADAHSCSNSSVKLAPGSLLPSLSPSAMACVSLKNDNGSSAPMLERVCLEGFVRLQPQLKPSATQIWKPNGCIITSNSNTTHVLLIQ